MERRRQLLYLFLVFTACLAAGQGQVLNCDFEQNLCQWQQVRTDYLDWTRHSGTTPSTSTGPGFDHTLGIGKGGYYVYLETSTGASGVKAQLISPPISLVRQQASCLSLWYHMYGSHVNTLAIYLSRNTTSPFRLWTRSGSQGYNWLQAHITIYGPVSNQKFIIEAVRGTSYRGDIAIDDITWHARPCSSTGLVSLTTAATVAPSVAANTTASAVDDCDDDPNGDCWTRPGADCFGIYEPWSHVHCPLRCGFCPGKLPVCEDKLPYCDRFEDVTCTAENYKIWARNNCRKHCNLCDVPTRPSGYSTMTTRGQGQGQGTGSTAANPDGSSTTAANMDNTTHVKPTAGVPHDIPGTVARGEQSTILIQGPTSQMSGMCLYHGKDYKEGERWYDGCTYTCSCMDASKNLVICTERCERWTIDADLTICKMVPEEGECCPRLECN